LAKIAIINDTHFGVNNNSQRRLKYQLDYFDEQFFPRLKTEGIKQILHLGDFWESRKEVNPNTFHWVKSRFLDKLKEYGIVMDIVPGNHDMYFTQFSNVTSLTMLHTIPNVNVHYDPTLFEIDKLKFSLIPWISNEDDFKKMDTFLKENPHDVVFGHFHLLDFFVTKHLLNSESLVPRGYFADYHSVFSGHFHLRQINGNIHYLGTQYEMDWNDSDDEKGFSIFDTTTKKSTYIKNTDKLHIRFFYNGAENKTYLDELPKLHGKFVRVIVENKTSEHKFQSFLNELDKVGCEKFVILERDPGENQTGDEVVFSDDTPLILFMEDYCNTQTSYNEKDKINVIKILKKAYQDVIEDNQEDEPEEGTV
jgi:DNA repair exonuclease SbcCD nuclease subunit